MKLQIGVSARRSPLFLIRSVAQVSVTSLSNDVVLV